MKEKSGSNSGESSSDEKKRRRRPKTVVGRMFSDFVDLPWDKVLAAMISGLLITVGAARMFHLTEEVQKNKVEMAKLHKDISHEIHTAKMSMDTSVHMVQLELKNTEERILRAVRTELKFVYQRFEEAQEERSDLQKKMAVLEIRNQLCQGSNSQHQKSNGMLEYHENSAFEAIQKERQQWEQHLLQLQAERKNRDVQDQEFVQMRSVINEATDVFSSVTSEFKQLKAALDKMRSLHVDSFDPEESISLRHTNTFKPKENSALPNPLDHDNIANQANTDYERSVLSEWELSTEGKEERI